MLPSESPEVVLGLVRGGDGALVGLSTDGSPDAVFPTVWWPWLDPLCSILHRNLFPGLHFACVNTDVEIAGPCDEVMFSCRGNYPCFPGGLRSLVFTSPMRRRAACPHTPRVGSGHGSVPVTSQCGFVCDSLITDETEHISMHLRDIHISLIKCPHVLPVIHWIPFFTDNVEILFVASPLPDVFYKYLLLICLLSFPLTVSFKKQGT